MPSKIGDMRGEIQMGWSTSLKAMVKEEIADRKNDYPHYIPVRTKEGRLKFKLTTKKDKDKDND